MKQRWIRCFFIIIEGRWRRRCTNYPVEGERYCTEHLALAIPTDHVAEL